jgi:hypothetical protein
MKKFLFWLLAPPPALVLQAVPELARAIITLGDQVQTLQKIMARNPSVPREFRESLRDTASRVELANERLEHYVGLLEKDILKALPTDEKKNCN